MVDPNVSQDQKRELLRKAVNSHKNYVNDVGLLLHTHRFPNTVKPVLNDHLPKYLLYKYNLFIDIKFLRNYDWLIKW
jgi:hypothetical protein